MAEVLTDEEIIKVLSRINHAMVEEVHDPVSNTVKQELRLHWQVMLESVRRYGLSAFVEGVLLGTRRSDDEIGRIRQVLADKRSRLLVNLQPGEFDLSHLPTSLGGTSEYLRYVYAIKGIEVGRREAPLQVRVPYGGPIIDFEQIEGGKLNF